MDWRRGGRLAPASTWDLTGGDDPRRGLPLRHGRAIGDRTRQLPASGIVHIRYAVDPRRPWAGLPPTAYASTTGVFLANLEQRLAQEMGAPVSALLPVLSGGGDDGL